MSFTSDEVNYLIYRYLKESGFTHSAFAFGHESNIIKHDVNPTDIPTGSLINIIQKGLLYQEIESEIKNENAKAEIESPVLVKQLSKPSTPQEKKKQQTQILPQREYMEIESTSSLVSSDQIIQLDGHKSEVFNCEWNPFSNFVASCSADSTARIWKLAFGKDGIDLEKTIKDSIILDHTISSETTNVVSIDWNEKGTLLATGTYSGAARIWNLKGETVHQLFYHNQPIFSIKWNKSGTLLLTGSIDKKSAIWDAKDGVLRRDYEASEKILDVDWKDDNVFAVGTSDGQVYIYNVNEQSYLKSLLAHSKDVNSVRWSPNGSILASCSDDNTAKLWSSKNYSLLHTLGSHKEPVYALRWSPTGPGSANPNLPLMLATASFDKTARLWDPQTGKCLFTLGKHTESVNSIAFSPNGQYIASASFDKFVHVWSTRDGSLVKSYECKGGILEVHWDHSSQRLAAASSDNSVFIMELSM